MESGLAKFGATPGGGGLAPIMGVVEFMMQGQSWRSNWGFGGASDGRCCVAVRVCVCVCFEREEDSSYLNKIKRLSGPNTSNPSSCHLVTKAIPHTDRSSLGLVPSP